MRRRLDLELVRRGLVDSRSRALVEIDAGRVVVGGAPAHKAASMVEVGAAIEVLGPRPRFVGRGGEKLDAALDRFAVDVTGRRALDAGVSTGGFSDCLLQRGARQVLAVDVGYGQLHERLRVDPCLVVWERRDIRSVGVGDLDDVGGALELAVADLSFISLRTVLPTLFGLVVPGAPVVALVKPQFEAGRREASRGRGVVRDPEVWRRVLGEICVAVAGDGGAMMGAMASPLTGARGNVEFLVHLLAPGGARGTVAPGDLDAAVTEAVALHGAGNPSKP